MTFWPRILVNRAFKHMNASVYVPMQGTSELGAGGKLTNWDRTADLKRITVPTLTIGMGSAREALCRRPNAKDGVSRTQRFFNEIRAYKTAAPSVWTPCV